MARYKPDYEGTGRLMRSPQIMAVVGAEAGRGIAFARSIAPVRTGDYEAQMHLESTDRGGKDHDRAEARIVDGSPHAILVEVYDGYHTLKRTAEFLAAT